MNNLNEQEKSLIKEIALDLYNDEGVDKTTKVIITNIIRKLNDE